MKEFKAYQCGFCKKYGKQRSRILQHESTCFHNPQTRSCATCIHLHQKEYEVERDSEAAFAESDYYIDQIPICNEGVDVSCFADNKKNVYLKTQCPLWENEEYEPNS